MTSPEKCGPARIGDPTLPPPSLLLTGFEPFDGHRLNPSALVAERLHGCVIGGWRVESRSLPVDFSRIDGALRQAWAQAHPGAVLALGLAWGRAAIEVETVARNRVHLQRPDKGGRLIRNHTISGAARLHSTLCPRRAVRAMRAAGAPAKTSGEAGTHLCNYVFHRTLTRFFGSPGVRTGFIHLPPLPEMDPPLGRERAPSLELDIMLKAIGAAIAAIDDPGGSGRP